MRMMSITEVQQLWMDRRPVYAKKKIYVYRGQDISDNSRPAKPYGIAYPGYLGPVIGYVTFKGIIYLQIDDVNIYVDGLYFYVVADWDSIAVNEADAPKTEPGFFEKLWNDVTDGTAGAFKFVAGPIVKAVALVVGGYLVYRLMSDEAKEKTKELMDKSIKAGKTALDKGKKALAK